MAEYLSPIVTGLVSGGISTAGFAAALRVHLRWIRRDLDNAGSRIEHLPCVVGTECPALKYLKFTQQLQVPPQLNK